MYRFILTRKQRGLSSLLFPKSGCYASLVTQSNLIYELQIIIDQVHLDDSVRELLSKMHEVYTFLTTAGLNEIQSMKAVVERIAHQTLECSHFIQAYYANQKFCELTWS